MNARKSRPHCNPAGELDANYSFDNQLDATGRLTPPGAVLLLEHRSNLST
jgi:hypothetical protein